MAESFCAAHLTSGVLAAMLKATKTSETNMAELMSYLSMISFY